VNNRVLDIVLAIVCISICLFSQSKIDFSGEWILNKERSQFQLKEFESLERGLVIIHHREPVCGPRLKYNNLWILEKKSPPLL